MDLANLLVAGQRDSSTFYVFDLIPGELQGQTQKWFCLDVKYTFKYEIAHNFGNSLFLESTLK